MSVTWRQDSRHFCGHPRCRRLEDASTSMLAGGYACVLAWSVTATQPVLWGVAAGGCVLAGLVLARWPHPRAGAPDIEAVADATCEQHFPPLGGHFDEWAKELDR